MKKLPIKKKKVFIAQKKNSYSKGNYHSRYRVLEMQRLMQIVGPRRIGLTERKLYSQIKADSLDKIVRTIRLRWVGHVRRMLDTRLPKIVLFGDILTGKHYILQLAIIIIDDFELTYYKT
ncbi:hypothetical protein BpHYR1_051321 [Brachionus plicatilis]|uniref:RNA-directed DNA polymerase from mobile element jockey-like n=1 Tax=Brachionus plicatilis TaxID=10195 RepID=A0A3M7PVJ0_BRAPC|nr:hypothetical protein BpHYR1_051321 [Brachionus plicatilis]